MANFLQSPKLHSIFLFSTLVAFSINSFVQPIHAVQTPINLNDIGFAIRLEKLVEKINRYTEKEDSHKLLEALVDLKMEVEGYTGKKINLDYQLEQVEYGIKVSGGDLKKSELKSIRKMIKKKEKRANHKAVYMATCLECDTPFNAEEEHHLFIAKHGHEIDKDEDKICVPIRVTIGVTLALCGLFLYLVPIPVCKVWAPELMKGGIALAVEGGINRVEEDKKK